ncbi:MAG: hypothetical protein Q8K97_07575 [Pseudohongiella sp.]|nr:hypothetical protein [Pseudohongiella sp.]
MPDIEMELSDDDRQLLETIREQEGLETLDQAAQWLVKQRLRNASLRLTGRNRAIYVVRK